MNRVDQLYSLANVLSFLAMAIMLIDALLFFYNGVSPTYLEIVFWIFFGGMFLLTLQAKRLDPKRVNPNMIVPTSRYIYFIGMGAFVVGYFFLEKGTIALIIAYAISTLCELLSGFIAFQTMQKMRSSR